MAVARRLSPDLVVLFGAVTFVGTVFILTMKASSDALCIWRPDAGCVIGPGIAANATCDPCRLNLTPMTCALARPCEAWHLCRWNSSACVSDGGELTRAMTSINETCVITEEAEGLVDAGCGALETGWACEYGTATVAEALEAFVVCGSMA